jgi:integrase
VWAKQRVAQAFDILHDVGRVMLLRWPRPSEVIRTRAEHVDVARAGWLIAASKSKAARRVLQLRPEARASWSIAPCRPVPKDSCFGAQAGPALSDAEDSHKRVLEASGPAFVIYDFRHTFATRFAEELKWGRCGFGVDPGPCKFANADAVSARFAGALPEANAPAR